MGWVVHEIRIEEAQNGYFRIYFNGKRYFGNSRRKLRKNVKSKCGYKWSVFFSGLDLFFSCSEICRVAVVECKADELLIQWIFGL